MEGLNPGIIFYCVNFVLYIDHMSLFSHMSGNCHLLNIKTKYYKEYRLYYPPLKDISSHSGRKVTIM